MKHTFDNYELRAIRWILLGALVLFSYWVSGQTINIQKQKGVDLIINITDKPDVVIPPIPPDSTLNVDNIDAKLSYVGGNWTNGSTTATGFYANTMAYASVAGHQAALTFTGNSIEVFCEKKTGHGSGAFQVDNQAVETIPLGVAGPVGSTSVFKKTLSPGKHTFKLTVTGSGNVVFDYIKINGRVIVIPPITPIPPVTPPTGAIIVNPGQSIKAAVESAAAGKTVTVLAGTYNEPNMNVPTGVSVMASGIVRVVATTPGVSGNVETGLFILKSSSMTPGNQTISGFILEGNNVGYGGIIAENRSGLKIKNNIIQNFNMHGIWVRTVTDSEITDNTLDNTAWASDAYSSGQINIFALTRVDILRNTFKTNKNNKGTGIEALWKESRMTGLRIMYNTFALSHQNPWAGGKARNFSIEIHDTHYDGIEIAFNNFSNQLSMASHKPATTSNKTLIHDNTGDLGGDTMFIENICDNLEAYNNTVTNGLMFAANFQPNSVWKNNNFYNNTFTSSGAVSWGGMFLIGPLGVQNFVIKNNILKLNGNVKVAYMGVTGGVTETGNTWQ